MKKYELSAENAWDMAKGIYTGLTTDPIGFGKELGKACSTGTPGPTTRPARIGHLVPDAVDRRRDRRHRRRSPPAAPRAGSTPSTRWATSTSSTTWPTSASCDRPRRARRRTCAASTTSPTTSATWSTSRSTTSPRARSSAWSRRATRSGSSPGRRCSASSRRATVDDYLRGSSDTTLLQARPDLRLHLARRGRRPAAHPARDARQARPRLQGLRRSARPRRTSTCCATTRPAPTASSSLDTRTSGATATTTRTRSTRRTRSPATATPRAASPSSAPTTPTTMPAAAPRSGGWTARAARSSWPSLTDYMGTKMWMPVQ